MSLVTIEYSGDATFRAVARDKHETVGGSLDVVLATVREWIASETWSDAPDVGADYDKP